jgi:hypothetical protein
MKKILILGLVVFLAAHLIGGRSNVTDETGGPQSFDPRTPQPALSPMWTLDPDPAPTNEPSKIQIVSLKGRECYTGSSDTAWDNVRVTLTLTVRNLSQQKSAPVFIGIQTDQGGPLTRYKLRANLKSGFEPARGGENGITWLVVQGTPPSVNQTITYEWQQEFFWNPVVLELEVWEGQTGAGRYVGPQLYSVTNGSPPGLNPCS